MSSARNASIWAVCRCKNDEDAEIEESVWRGHAMGANRKCDRQQTGDNNGRATRDSLMVLGGEVGGNKGKDFQKYLPFITENSNILPKFKQHYIYIVFFILKFLSRFSGTRNYGAVLAILNTDLA